VWLLSGVVEMLPEERRASASAYTEATRIAASEPRRARGHRCLQRDDPADGRRGCRACAAVMLTSIRAAGLAGKMLAAAHSRLVEGNRRWPLNAHGAARGLPPGMTAAGFRNSAARLAGARSTPPAAAGLPPRSPMGLDHRQPERRPPSNARVAPAGLIVSAHTEPQR